LDWDFHNDNKSQRIQITFNLKNNAHHRPQNAQEIAAADERLDRPDERARALDK
jgi:hypothetical protein